MANSFNNKNIASVSLIPEEAADFFINAKSWKREEIFNHQAFIYKKMTYIVFDNTIPITADTAIKINEKKEIRIIHDVENISFESESEKGISGTLYNNKLRYTVPQLDKEEAEAIDQQLALMQSGKGFHLLIRYRDCEEATAFVICPSDEAFSCTTSENDNTIEIEITILNTSSLIWGK
jgi:hypothetical protein